MVDELKKFFSENQKFLEENYPGLRFDYLQSFYPETFQEKQKFFTHLREARPLEYFSGRSFFYRSEFLVTPDVLIPRKETELLVEHGKKFLIKENFQDEIRVCDVGTGSGNILLSLLSDLSFPVTALGIDVSEEALSIAKKNLWIHRYQIHPQSEVELRLGERLRGVTKKFHLILSNPPYIKKNLDAKTVHSQVFMYEPHEALFLEDREYNEWFHVFFNQVSEHLERGGGFFMEGHENHLEGLFGEISKEDFSRRELFPDLTGRKRFLFLQK